MKTTEAAASVASNVATAMACLILSLFVTDGRVLPHLNQLSDVSVHITIDNYYKEQQTMATEALKDLLLCLLTSGRPMGSGLPTGVDEYSSQVTGA